MIPSLKSALWTQFCPLTPSALQLLLILHSSLPLSAPPWWNFLSTEHSEHCLVQAQSPHQINDLPNTKHASVLHLPPFPELCKELCVFRLLVNNI